LGCDYRSKVQCSESHNFDGIAVGKLRDDAESAAERFNISAECPDVGIRPMFEARDIALSDLHDLRYRCLRHRSRAPDLRQIHSVNLEISKRAGFRVAAFIR